MKRKKTHIMKATNYWLKLVSFEMHLSPKPPKKFPIKSQH